MKDIKIEFQITKHENYTLASDRYGKRTRLMVAVFNNGTVVVEKQRYGINGKFIRDGIGKDFKNIEAVKKHYKEAMLKHIRPLYKACTQ